MQHMLHGIINEKGHCIDVRDDTSGKMNIFQMFSFNLLEVLVFGAYILEMIFIADFI